MGLLGEYLTLPNKDGEVFTKKGTSVLGIKG